MATLPDVVKDEQLGHLGEYLAAKILKELEISFEDLDSLERLPAASFRSSFAATATAAPRDRPARPKCAWCQRQMQMEPVESFQILLLANLEEDLHRVWIILDAREAAKVILDFIP
jgi:hypothetical protein